MNQKGFIPIAIIIGILIVGVIGTIVYVKQQQNNSKPNTSSASQEEKISTSPSPSATNNPQLAKSTPSPTSKPSTSTKAPANTPNPTNNNSNNSSNPTSTPTIAPANTPTPQPTATQPTPTPTPIFSTAKPALTVTGPYTIGDSGPCFDLSSKHPYNYTQSANYKFDENESSYRYTSLRDDGYSGKATVCWVKDSSKTGKQYVFKAKSYVDVSGHDPIYSDEVSIPYTHP